MKLTERDRRTLRALADTLLPEGGPLPSAAAVDVPGAIESTLDRLPSAQAGRVVALVRAFSCLAVSSRGRRFRNLSPAGRARVLERLGRQHGYRGQLFGALKQLVVTTWGNHPDVAAALGADTGCLTDSPDHHELVGRWLPAAEEA
ncbi:MAG: gluconate 2-dehydrogenase subunit 3 family protein [Actinobacteria bacterium]|nr:gluconate 2-dehydrogenase subunit 3 family protein [Actinomycetota bacterium]